MSFLLMMLLQFKGVFDLLLVMVKLALDWPALINALALNSRLQFVGAKFVPITAEYTG